MSEPVTAAETKPAAFDPHAYIRDANVTEQARREGKAPEAKPVETKPAEVKAEPVEQHTSRSQRREQNRLREELGVERGKRELLEQQLAERAKPADGKAEDPEPV